VIVLEAHTLQAVSGTETEAAVQLALSAQLLARTHSLEEILDLLRSLGIDAVEIWPQNIPGKGTLEPQAGYERKNLASARRVVEAYGMTVACVTLGGRAVQRCMVDGPRVGTDALKGAVDAAATLGARVVNCYLAGIAPAVFVQAVQPAAEYAGSLGVTIVLENEAHDDSGTALGVRAIVEAVGSPHFATLYDPCSAASHATATPASSLWSPMCRWSRRSPSIRSRSLTRGNCSSRSGAPGPRPAEGRAIRSTDAVAPPSGRSR